MFRRFGTEVSIFEMLPRIGPGGGRRGLEGTGARLQEGKVFASRPAPKCEQRSEDRQGREDEGHALERQGGGVEAEKLLVAVGRAPNTANIGLENTKVELDRGFIKVNEYQQTGEPGIYAIGDVVAGTPQLAHVATHAGHGRGGENGGQAGALRSIAIAFPGATYTEPGIGSVGLTEAQARAAGYKVKVGKFPFVANSKATHSGHRTTDS